MQERENPSLISLMVSVCVKHQVYLLTEVREGGKETDRQTDRDTEGERQTETDTQRQRQKDDSEGGRKRN